MNSLTLFVLIAISAVYVSAKLQNVTVKGITVCQKRRMANQRVQLFDRDTLDPNDLLAEVHTNKDGEFSLYGEEDEVGSIEPFLRIHHNCNTKPGCTRISDYEIPHSKIGDVYDMTYVTLDIVTMRSLVLFALLAMCSVSVFAKMQNVTVKGITVCNKKRLANVHVELYDKDTLDPNDLLAEMHTNSEGEFELFGQEDEGCQRIGDYVVPHDKIGSTYDMTYVTLDINVHGEKEKC
ncbi:unnamed protein product [Nippostrongylus brasiliensis]|uniref:Transthyretin-like family protein n=1 Tax=Nippostrongylus brasiliensis TaxID=27835 RepID=A0A0N4XD31_NIPBR|nr:unnamed protein product [Nippostrongylus brasiliensis]